MNLTLYRLRLRYLTTTAGLDREALRLELLRLAIRDRRMKPIVRLYELRDVRKRTQMVFAEMIRRYGKR